MKENNNKKKREKIVKWQLLNIRKDLIISNCVRHVTNEKKKHFYFIEFLNHISTILIHIGWMAENMLSWERGDERRIISFVLNVECIIAGHYHHAIWKAFDVFSLFAIHCEWWQKFRLMERWNIFFIVVVRSTPLSSSFRRCHQ